MSTMIRCDFCGASKWDELFPEGAWFHNYATGKDQCPKCQEVQRKAEHDAMWAKIRAEVTGVKP